MNFVDVPPFVIKELLDSNPIRGTLGKQMPLVVRRVPRPDLPGIVRIIGGYIGLGTERILQAISIVAGTVRQVADLGTSPDIGEVLPNLFV